MKNKLIPEAVQTSYTTAFKINIWAAVTILISAWGRWYLSKHNPDPIIRVGISLLPLFPSALYVWAIGRWVRTLDELQRRIQQEAWFFATTGTIFVLTILNLLAANGVLAGSRLSQGLGWEGTYVVTFIFWVVGCIISNRRYQ